MDKLKPLIRLLVRVVFMTLHAVTGKLRYEWMAHYLSRKGTDKIVPEHILKCLNIDTFYADNDNCIVSTDYPEYGFYGRPELFYLVGGFIYQWENDNGITIIKAGDVYDWHPVKEFDKTGDLVGTWYFVSPIPFINEKWVWRLNDLFGHTFFDFSFDGQFGISNYFWDWLDGVSFVSHMEWRFS